MRPTYGIEQQGFDFGTTNLVNDVCSVFDMREFPDVSPEDITIRLKCRGDHAMVVYRKCMEVWEQILDREIVEELRTLPSRDQMSVEMMSIVLAEPMDQIESDITDALNSLGYALDQLEIAA